MLPKHDMDCRNQLESWSNLNVSHSAQICLLLYNYSAAQRVDQIMCCYGIGMVTRFVDDNGPINYSVLYGYHRVI